MTQEDFKMVKEFLGRVVSHCELIREKCPLNKEEFDKVTKRSQAFSEAIIILEKEVK